MAAEKLCDIDHEWEHSCTVKRGIRAMLHLYYEILQEKKKGKKIKTIDVMFFLDVFWNMALAFFSKIKSDLMEIFKLSV